MFQKCHCIVNVAIILIILAAQLEGRGGPETQCV